MFSYEHLKKLNVMYSLPSSSSVLASFPRHIFNSYKAHNTLCRATTHLANVSFSHICFAFYSPNQK